MSESTEKNHVVGHKVIGHPVVAGKGAPPGTVTDGKDIGNPVTQPGGPLRWTRMIPTYPTV